MLEQLPQHSFFCYQGYVLIFKNQPSLMWYVLTTEQITAVVKTRALTWQKKLTEKIRKCIQCKSSHGSLLQIFCNHQRQT